MEKNKKYGVWLTDEAGRAFMGKPDEPQSRWRVYGEWVSDEPGVGFWLRVEFVEQTTAMSESKAFQISPPLCLIPWNFVITIQVHGEAFQPVRLTDYKQ